MADAINLESATNAKRGSGVISDTDIPIWFLVACFILAPESPSGLRWRARPLEHFADGRRGEQDQKTWNAKWAGKPVGTPSLYYWHVVLTIKGKPRYLKSHRIIFALTNGRWPDGEVDHEDRAKSNNQTENLREATRSQNGQNTTLRSTNKSGFKGVDWHKRGRKWVASITVDRRDIHLGLFTDILDAIAARQAAELEHHPYRVVERLDADIVCLPPGMPPEIVAEWKRDVRETWKLPPRIHWHP